MQIRGHIDVLAVVEVAAVDQRNEVTVGDEQLAGTDVIMGGSGHLGGPDRIEENRVSTVQPPAPITMGGCGDGARTMSGDDAFDFRRADARSVDGRHQDSASRADRVHAAAQR